MGLLRIISIVSLALTLGSTSDPPSTWCLVQSEQGQHLKSYVAHVWVPRRPLSLTLRGGNLQGESGEIQVSAANGGPKIEEGGGLHAPLKEESRDENAGELGYEANGARKTGRGRRTKEAQQKRASSKLNMLNTLLQRAAAYSSFLKERLEQSQEEANLKSAPSNSGEPHNASAPVIDSRQPKLVTGAVMRGYQVDGVQWLISLYENGLNGILADEMGLGKTLQVIGFLSHLWEMKVRGPFLVVAPLSTIGNWVKEFERFAPEVPVILYHGSKEERAVLRRKELKPKKNGMPVVITSFEVSINDAKYLGQHSWKYLAVDEGHRLKNKDCKLLRELKSLKAANRLLLSGTPLQNNLSELWSLLNFILPDIFDDLTTFQTWFNFDDELTSGGASRIVKEEEESRIVSKLHAVLDPFLLRRLKTDVALELPNKRVYVIFAGLTEQQLKYNGAIASGTLAHMLEQNSKQNPTTIAQSNPHKSLENTMTQMRKCCNHPYLFEAPIDKEGDWVIDHRVIDCSGKMQLLDRMLQTLKANGHKVLIFFQMTRMMDLVEDYMNHIRGWDCCRIDGTVSYQDRQEQMRRFESNPETFCFLLSTRSGGLGISLPAADTVIIYDSDFNPQQDLQAQDRCHRLGQKKPVGVYRIVTRDSVEVEILRRAVTKRKLELMTINRKRFKVHNKLQDQVDVKDLMGKEVDVKQTFTVEELERLLRVNVDPSKQGLISDEGLQKLLLERGDNAVTGNGQGWEVVDAETSSFVV